jgi:hypothetical protein
MHTPHRRKAKASRQRNSCLTCLEIKEKNTSYYDIVLRFAQIRRLTTMDVHVHFVKNE